jgi:iron(III) transport system ATP-binding protein
LWDTHQGPAITPPTFLLLDEPFTGLDLALKIHLLNEIRQLSAAQGASILLVTHDPMEAMALCYRAVVLEGSKVYEAGVLKDLFDAPKSETLQLFKSHVSMLPRR